MAARIRRDLGVDVKGVAGHYGEFTVLVGEDIVISGGPLGWMGVLPSAREVVDAVRAKIA